MYSRLILSPVVAPVLFLFLFPIVVTVFLGLMVNGPVIFGLAFSMVFQFITPFLIVRLTLSNEKAQDTQDGAQ